MRTKPHIAVIGAGAFGGWTALHLLERGARVTLIDAWGPGNSRASSGGETRVMRGTYGPDQPYTEMAAHAMKLWTKYERRWKRRFLHRTGVLWMAAPTDDAYERGSLKPMRRAKIPFQELSAAAMKKRWPQINFEGIDWGIFEPGSGYLDARASCRAVVDAFIAQGGRYRQAAALPDAEARFARAQGDVEQLQQEMARCEQATQVETTRYEHAEKLLARCLELSPGSHDIRQNYATVLHRQHKSEEAIAQADLVLKDDPRDLGMRSLKASALSQIGEEERAAAEYELLLKEQPGRPKLWMRYGHALKALGRQTELVVYPGEYHEFKTPSHIKDLDERFLAWYGHYVKADGTPARPTEKSAGAEGSH